MSILTKMDRLLKKDAQRAIELVLEGIKKYNSSPLLKRAKFRSITNKTSRFILLREQKELIGFLMYRIEGEMCYIYEIHVNINYRSRGEGQRMFNELFLSMRGFIIVLFVHKENHDAIRFYEKNEFEIDPDYESSIYHRMAKFN